MLGNTRDKNHCPNIPGQRAPIIRRRKRASIGGIGPRHGTSPFRSVLPYTLRVRGRLAATPAAYRNSSSHPHVLYEFILDINGCLPAGLVWKDSTADTRRAGTDAVGGDPAETAAAIRDDGAERGRVRGGAGVSGRGRRGRALTAEPGPRAMPRSGTGPVAQALDFLQVLIPSIA